MSRSLNRFVFVMPVALVFCSGCIAGTDSSSVDPPCDIVYDDAGKIVDTGTPDSNKPDSGTPLDTEVVDTGALDTGLPDSDPGDTILDTLVSDTGTADTLIVDTGLTDTGSLDATIDTVVADTGVDLGLDTFVPDTSVTETAVDSTVVDTAVDTQPLDTGVSDTRVSDVPFDLNPVDTGPADTGPADTGPADTGPADTGPADTGPADTGPADTGPADTGVADTGPADTGPADTGPADTGPADTGATDTGSDATDTIVRRGPAPVNLGSAGNYVILGEAAISTVPFSIITGDIGISPAAASFITGFSMTRAGTFWTAPQVVGRIFAADNDPPTPALLTIAIGDEHTAYTDAAGRPTPDFLNLGGGALDGLVLVPGLYKFTTSVTIGADITISGNADDTWIFQMTGDLLEAASKNVKLLGGAKAKNIVWQVAGLTSISTGAHMEGVILCKTGITMRTGASVNGRLYGQTAIILDSNTVTTPTP